MTSGARGWSMRMVLISAALAGYFTCSPLTGSAQAGGPLTLIPAHGPLEISGVAALPDGKRYAVVGDDTDRHGRIWPGGAAWKVKPKIGDMESVDVAVAPDGEVLWLVLGEDDRLLAEPRDKHARHQLGEAFREVCGRGLEGLTLRHHDDKWQAVVLWEGGFYDPDDCDDNDKDLPGTTGFAIPKIALVAWQKGKGPSDISPPIELDVPAAPNGRFRATDVAWHGDEIIVLLGATGAGGRPPYAHTWLQRFDLTGNIVGAPVKLEDDWGDFRKHKNWEALDTTPDGQHLVMGYDGKRGSSTLVVFENPFN